MSLYLWESNNVLKISSNFEKQFFRGFCYYEKKAILLAKYQDNQYQDLITKLLQYQNINKFYKQLFLLKSLFRKKT